MKPLSPIRQAAFLFLLLTGSASSNVWGQGSSEEQAAPEIQQSVDVEVGFTSEHLTNGFAPWRSGHVQVTRRFAVRKVLYAQFERTRRHSQTDSAITVGGYYPLGARWTAVAEVNASPTHRVLATWSALGQVEHDFGRGWTGQAGMRHRQYNTTGVRIANVGAAKSFNVFRVGYILYASSVAEAGVAVTNRVDGTYHYGNSALTLTVAYGKDRENIVPNGVLSTSVRAAGVHGVHWISSSWAASYAVGWHNQGNIYTRQGLTLGLRYRL
jgi:YaiO family outer membrane protein